MSEQVSTLLNVNIGEMKYLFFVVSRNDYSSKIKDELEKQFNAFGEDLGPDAKVIKPYNSAIRRSFEEIQGKPWTKEIRERIDAELDPFMLIVNKSFNEFDPNQDPWSVVWLSNFYENPDLLYRLLGALSLKMHKGEDIFQYMKSVTKKEKLKKYTNYFDLKPGIYGISIDIKALVLDLFGV